MAESVLQAFGELAALLGRSASEHAATIELIASRYTEALRNGGTLYFGGNGGSAADAQHCAGEYVVFFTRSNRSRPAYAAVALGTDVAMLSTSGQSPNLLEAARVARARGVTVIALLGRDGGALRALADIALVVDHDDTGRIQLVHMAAQHVIVGMVEARLAGTP